MKDDDDHTRKNRKSNGGPGSSGYDCRQLVVPEEITIADLRLSQIFGIVTYELIGYANERPEGKVYHVRIDH